MPSSSVPPEGVSMGRFAEMVCAAVLVTACGSAGRHEEEEEHKPAEIAGDPGGLHVAAADATRIGLTTVAVERRAVTPRRLFAGVTEAAPGASATVTAPVSGQLQARA